MFSFTEIGEDIVLKRLFLNKYNYVDLYVQGLAVLSEQNTSEIGVVCVQTK